MSSLTIVLSRQPVDFYMLFGDFLCQHSKAFLLENVNFTTLKKISSLKVLIQAASQSGCFIKVIAFKGQP